MNACISKNPLPDRKRLFLGSEIDLVGRVEATIGSLLASAATYTTIVS